MAVDPIDVHILQVLQHRGRLPNQSLAETVGLSPSACHRRVRQLEDRGVIRGYAALIDPAFLGASQRVYVEITLASQRQDALQAFEEAVGTCPEILACHLMSGDADYLLALGVSGIDGYERLHREKLAQLPGVSRVRSSFAIRTVVERLGPVITELQRAG